MEREDTKNIDSWKQKGGIQADGKRVSESVHNIDGKSYEKTLYFMCNIANLYCIQQLIYGKDKAPPMVGKIGAKLAVVIVVR